jgi:hypothetical protein
LQASRLFKMDSKNGLQLIKDKWTVAVTVVVQGDNPLSA